MDSSQGLSELCEWTSEEFKFKIETTLLQRMCKRLREDLDKESRKLLIICLGNICLESEEYRKTVLEKCFTVIFEVINHNLQSQLQNEWRLLASMLPITSTLIHVQVGSALLGLISSAFNYSCNLVMVAITLKRVLLAAIRLDPFMGLLKQIQLKVLYKLTECALNKQDEYLCILLLEGLNMFYALSDQRLSKHMAADRLIFQLLNLESPQITKQVLSFFHKDTGLSITSDLVNKLVRSVKHAECRLALTKLIGRLLNSGLLQPCREFIQLTGLLLEDSRSEVILRGLEMMQWMAMRGVDISQLERQVEGLMLNSNKEVCNRAQSILQHFDSQRQLY